MNEELELIVEEYYDQLTNMNPVEVRHSENEELGKGFKTVRLLPINRKHLENVKQVDDETLNITYHKNTAEKLENMELARIEGKEYNITLKPFRDETETTNT